MLPLTFSSFDGRDGVAGPLNGTVSLVQRAIAVTSSGPPPIAVGITAGEPLITSSEPSRVPVSGTVGRQPGSAGVYCVITPTLRIARA